MIVTLILLVVIAIPLYYVVRAGTPASTKNISEQTGAAEWTIEVTGNVNNPMNLTISQFEALPSLNTQATLRSSSNPQLDGTWNFTGIVLWSLLEKAGISGNASTIDVQGSDGYISYFTVQEVKQNSQILLAYEQNGAPIQTQAEGGNGPIWLVVGSDYYAIRWVKYVVLIDVS